MSHIEIPLDKLDPDPDQPRREFPEQELRELGASLKSTGQLVLIIVIMIGDRYQIVDGERRARAAGIVGLKTLRAEVLLKKPTRAELTVMQLVVNAQRTDLLALEELDAYGTLMQTLQCSATELAQKLCVSKSKVTRILSLRALTDEQRELVRSGAISSANAYAISRMDEAGQAKAMELINAGLFSRDKAERLSSSKGKESSPGRKSLQLQAGSALVRIASDDSLSIDGVLNVLEDVTRELKKARSQGLDVSTAVHVLRDRARKHNSAEALS